MSLKQFVLYQVNFTVFLGILCLANGVQNQGSRSLFVSSTSPKPILDENTNGKLSSGTLLKKDQILSPLQNTEEKDEDNGLIEVKEEDIPEGSMVYVLEEPIDSPTDGEVLKTADNIVFRPLFRYRGKQEAQRRNYNNRIRRRYFIPRRSYRNSYYSSYYPYRYY